MVLEKQRYSGYCPSATAGAAPETPPNVPTNPAGCFIIQQAL